TQSTLKEFANWFVGSEEQEPGHGWNYTPILKAMNNSGADLTGDELGKIIVDGFLAQAVQQETNAVTLSVVNLAKLPLLETSLNNLFSAAIANNEIQKLQKARSKAEEYSKSLTEPEYSEDMVDIGDMMKELKGVAPTLITLANDVLAKLDEVVIYNRHDNARPKASGIAMYVPHQALVKKDVLDDVINNHYNPIDFNPGLKNFIKSQYIPRALADVSPPSGQTDPDFGFGNKNHASTGVRNSSLVSAVKVTHDDDLEQVQVMLIKELEGTAREYLMLGSTYPDTVAFHNDGSATYAYRWDDQWLSLNGHPAYISDIFSFDVVDSLGKEKALTRILIPAVKNLETTSEEFLILSYTFDEDFKYTLESIIPEPVSDGSGGMIVPKRRVSLKAGDKIQLLYEAFNEDTDEEFFVVNDDDIITITNGNSDLKLGYSDLSSGRYQIGFLLEDHSQNDTLIFDDKVFVIQASGLDKIINDNNFKIYPNPASDIISVSFNEFDGSSFQLNVYDLNGQKVLTKVLVDQVSNVPVALNSGMYLIEIVSKDRRIIDKLIISK
ncbi:MAG: clostripain-related cysteine peptidase, partial [Saprospiraceae bacterium]